MKNKHPFELQLKENLVALISLMVALAALGYTTWREEVTERNRNYRQASFEVLKGLGELQAIVNRAYFLPANEMENPFSGWGNISMISDLSKLLPPPVPSNIEKLKETWDENWDKLKTDKASVEKISQEIDTSRKAIVSSIMELK